MLLVEVGRLTVDPEKDLLGRSRKTCGGSLMRNVGSGGVEERAVMVAVALALFWTQAHSEGADEDVEDSIYRQGLHELADTSVQHGVLIAQSQFASHGQV